MTAQKKVIINGNVLLYEAKAPYTPSGHSLKGVLEYDPDEDKVMCHECGEWFRDVGIHALQSHGMPSQEYKATHGLQPGAALFSEGLRIKRIAVGKRRYPGLVAAGKLNTGRAQMSKRHKVKHRAAIRASQTSAERQNARRICPAQLLERLKICARTVGHTPTQKELREHGLSYATLVRRFGSMKNAATLADLTPNIALREKYSGRFLISIIRNFIATHGRVPARSDCRRGLIPHDTVFSNHFGSWNKAIAAAGFQPYTQGRGQIYRGGRCHDPNARKPIQNSPRRTGKKTARAHA